MRKIFVFGNEFFEGDEVAKELAKIIQTKDFEFIHAESPNEILNASEELIILDVVKGLKKVKLIDKIDDLVLANSLTCHDLDLGFYLKLMQETGQVKLVKIIGIPFGNSDYKYLKKEVENILVTI
ncbi:MAG: hypothetical protein PF569_07260 [Candidatus Woesearchaeota archaeon]|jgi:Ni,Fe-hydrogenase maturation factor|nr:hypothetical protein [Candidatus Woesearchaeota archaeon]